MEATVGVDAEIRNLLQSLTHHRPPAGLSESPDAGEPGGENEILYMARNAAGELSPAMTPLQDADTTGGAHDDGMPAAVLPCLRRESITFCV